MKIIPKGRIVALYGVKKKGGAFFYFFSLPKQFSLNALAKTGRQALASKIFLQKKSQTPYLHETASTPYYVLSSFYGVQKIRHLSKMPKAIRVPECTDCILVHS
jgi:hypothetical protein